MYFVNVFLYPFLQSTINLETVFFFVLILTNSAHSNFLSSIKFYLIKINRVSVIAPYSEETRAWDFKNKDGFEGIVMNTTQYKTFSREKKKQKK